MRRIAHLSDLHFGRDRPELLEPLVSAVNDLSPDLVAISGDLTQRARARQFEAARDFIERLNAPTLVVPGNHDVPLDNVFVRLLNPWGRYRRLIDRNLEQEFRDAEMTVIGVNTVNPLSWQRGRIARRAVGRVCDVFRDEPAGRTRIVVVHHPLEQRPGERKGLMRGARKAVDALAACGADIVLCGHLHRWRAGSFAERAGRAGVIQAQAGTGLSHRLRGEDNDFNLLILDGDEARVERHVARGGGFAREAVARFRSGDRGWASSDRVSCLAGDARLHGRP